MKNDKDQALVESIEESCKAFDELDESIKEGYKALAELYESLGQLDREIGQTNRLTGIAIIFATAAAVIGIVILCILR